MDLLSRGPKWSIRSNHNLCFTFIHFFHTLDSSNYTLLLIIKDTYEEGIQ
uniref:Uncharacterized protein n=1 Tax=Lepeophtheirus salmonis TaxID=72036 RepID=A0A0K2UM03_LEPSM